MTSWAQDDGDRRRLNRQRAALLHLSVTLSQHGVEVAGEIVDISTRGARVMFREATPPFAPGDAVVFGLSTHVDPETLRLPAVVRWNSHQERSPTSELVVGLEFTEPDEDTTRALEAFVEIAQDAEADLERRGEGVAATAAAARPAGVGVHDGPVAGVDDASREGTPAARAGASTDSMHVAQLALHDARADLRRLLDKRVLLVCGKGGVGRTTVATALAHVAARRGRRVLLADIGDPGEGQCPLADALGRDELGTDPAEVAPGLQACHLWARRGQELFFGSVLPMRSLVRVAIGSRFVRVFLEAAPSFEEMGVFYHLLTLLRLRQRDGRPRHELIIVDMPATGHALALTGLPKILLRLIPGGPIVRLLKEGQSYLNDPQQAGACIVTLPEMLPVSEALELLCGMQEADVPTDAMILNRVPENPFSEREQAVVARLLEQGPTYGALTYKRISAARAASDRLAAATPLPRLTLPERWEESAMALVKKLVQDIDEVLEAG